jgi:hypothetical protein
MERRVPSPPRRLSPQGMLRNATRNRHNENVVAASFGCRTAHACPLRSEPNWRPKRKPCYEMQHEIDIPERRSSVLRTTQTARACPLRSEPNWRPKHKPCYEMQHEIDISERRSSLLRATRPCAPARYGAKHSWPAMLATHGYENRRRFGGREEYFRKNPIGGPSTSRITKCNTKSTYRNVVAASFGQPDRARLPVTERTQLAAQAQAVLRNATRNRQIGTSYQRPSGNPDRARLPVTERTHFTVHAHALRNVPESSNCHAMLRDVTPNPQESAHRPLQPRPPSCGCEHPFHGNGNGDLLSLTSSPCVHPPPAPIPIPPCTEPQPRPHPITRPKNIPIPPLFNYLPPFPYSPETAPSRRDATLLTEVPVRCSHFHAPVRQSPSAIPRIPPAPPAPTTTDAVKSAANKRLNIIGFVR